MRSTRVLITCLLLSLAAAACGGSENASSGSSASSIPSTSTDGSFRNDPAKDPVGPSDGKGDLGIDSGIVRGDAEAFPADATFAEFIDAEVPTGPGEHGDLLRYQPLPPADPSKADEGPRFRILYRSETVQGDPTFVTGLVSVPPGDAPEGGWKLASHAHGSTGLADDCAPSADPDAVAAVETLLVQRLGRDHGTVVASTDYEGQGGPGRHPFLVGVSEGRSVLDAAIAARQLPGVDVTTDEVGLLGYSQGGHAILWANQIAAAYAPDLEIVGTVSGSPASEIDGLAGSVMLWAGLAVGHPDGDLEEALDDLLTADGKAVLAALDRSCSATATDTPDVAPDAELFTADPLATEPWRGLLKANVPGAEAGASPLLVVHGDADESVPIETSETLRTRMCGAGAVVERRVVPGADHIEGAVPTYEQGFTWLDDLRAGTAPKDDC